MIPKALINLKNGCGSNWPRLKRIYIRYLDFKRIVAKSNLSAALKKEFDFYRFQKTFKQIEDMGFVDCPMKPEVAFTHATNVLTTFRRIPYSSEIMCFVIDGYAKGKSGNKKYPQFS